MWTAAERTFIQSLIKRDIPLPIIVKILLKNREGGLNKWKHLKMMINIIGYLACLRSMESIYGPNGNFLFHVWVNRHNRWLFMMTQLYLQLQLGGNYF